MKGVMLDVLRRKAASGASSASAYGKTFYKLKPAGSAPRVSSAVSKEIYCASGFGNVRNFVHLSTSGSTMSLIPKSTKSNRAVDQKKLRPMILKRIEQRAKDYPHKPAIPVALEVLRARNALYDGVSTLIHHIPVWACKYCPEVYVGECGHLIQSCHGYRHHSKKNVHEWVKASINDVIVRVESFHLQRMFQNVVRHNERFDHQRIPAVVELCLQAGVDANDPSVISPFDNADNTTFYQPLLDDDLRLIAKQTLHAWETLRSGVHKLLFVYPARVCKHCSEVHVGPSGHKARACGVFKYETWRGTHFWVKAKVDDLVPPKLVWYQRCQDPPILVDQGRNFYGHAPAVVDLCSKAGALAPSKYFCMMKVNGLTASV